MNQAGTLYADFSKQRVDGVTLSDLLKLALKPLSDCITCPAIP